MSETGGVLRARWVVRRTVYLLIGGAVAVAFVMLGSVIASPVQGDTIIDLRAPAVVSLVLMAAVGLLPGVREVQTAAAVTLLGRTDVTVPVPMRWRDRWRTAVWTFVHQIVGFASALAIAVATITVSGLVVLIAGTASIDAPLHIERPDSVGAWVVVGAGAAATVVAAVLIVIGGGLGARWAAPLLLGASGEDRLAAAEKRLRQEQEYRRLSRDLHDGVGHALSAISLQATAGERLVHRHPGRAAEALSSIQGLAADAVGELDHALGVLRDNGAPTQSEPTLADLPALIARYRDLGMELEVDADPDVRVPAPLSRLVHRISAEALSNAAKYAGPGPVSLQVRVQRDQLVVRSGNPSADRHHPPRDGHGLTGLSETVTAFGGTLSAGPEGTDWVLDVRLPTGGSRARR